MIRSCLAVSMACTCLCRLAAIIFSLILVSGSKTAFAGLLYHLTDLGVLSTQNPRSGGEGLNNHGVVVGESGVVAIGSNSHAFAWTAATGMTDLAASMGRGQSGAFDVNDAGQIIGSGPVSNNVVHAVIWSGGGFQDLGAPTGSTGSTGVSINSLGNVAGYSTINGHNLGFFWSSQGGLVSLPNLNGSRESIIGGINNSNEISGTVTLPSGLALAYTWTSSQGMQSLGVLPNGSQSGAFAINNLGQVAGASNVILREAVLWTPGNPIQPLGWLPNYANDSEGRGINDSGLVVGYSQASSGPIAGFVWDSTNGMQDLNQMLDSSGAGWHIGVATAINNLGQITGAGTAPDGDTHAFLLTPVPEPSSFLLLAVGGLAAVQTVLRRSKSLNWKNRPALLHRPSDIE